MPSVGAVYAAEQGKDLAELKEKIANVQNKPKRDLLFQLYNLELKYLRSWWPWTRSNLKLDIDLFFQQHPKVGEEFKELAGPTRQLF